MLHKVSIGQDRNKKDPHRGRKLDVVWCKVNVLHIIEIKKLPMGDGNVVNAKPISINGFKIEIKKIPIGDGNFGCAFLIILVYFIEIKKLPKGDGNSLTRISKSLSLPCIEIKKIPMRDGNSCKC